jgi:propanol-preferring alcohol dehydrogenase
VRRVQHCNAGHTRLCEQTRALMGTFAEHVTAWAPALVRFPDELGDQEAPLACGGLTAYGAVKKLINHDIVPGRPIAVIGAAGGLGHYAVQLATAFGYEVIGVDVGPERLDFVVKSLGASMALDASEALDVVQAQVGGVGASLIFSAKIAGFRLGFDLLGKRGLMVCGDLPATKRGQHRAQPLRVLRQGGDRRVVGRRHRAGHAGARAPSRGRRGPQSHLSYRATD